MEGKREPALLHGAIEPHIGVVVHLQMPHRGDHEAGHARPGAEGLDLPHACVGIGKRQAQHGVHAAAGFRQNFLGDPAVVGPAKIGLHLLLRMHADVEHAGREQAGVVDAHGVHPAVAKLDVAHVAFVASLLGAAHRIARHAAAHVLVADRLRREGAAAPRAGAGRLRELLEHFIFHERQDVGEVLVLVVVRVDVDDHDVVELALHRLLAGVGEQPAGVQLIDCDASATICNKVHDVFS